MSDGRTYVPVHQHCSCYSYQVPVLVHVHEQYRLSACSITIIRYFALKCLNDNVRSEKRLHRAGSVRLIVDLILQYDRKYLKKKLVVMFGLYKLLALCCLVRSVWSIPMQITVNQRAEECFYDTLQEGCVSYADTPLEEE